MFDHWFAGGMVRFEDVWCYITELFVSRSCSRILYLVVDNFPWNSKMWNEIIIQAICCCFTFLVFVTYTCVNLAKLSVITSRYWYPSITLSICKKSILMTSNGSDALNLCLAAVFILLGPLFLTHVHILVTKLLISLPVCSQ